MGKKRKAPSFEDAVRRAVKAHKLRPNFDSLERLCTKLSRRHADELRLRLYRREDVNGSMFIGPGLASLGYEVDLS